GPKRILIWSQMHGNESTGTKAVFDLLNFLSSNNELSLFFKENCEIEIIPMLNPDGAEKFTRENGKNIDLNRDAVAIDAIESKILRENLDSFNPHYCFNLHDQRSIFNVENTCNPATISFLAPSEDVNRTITKGRKQTMEVIVSMNKLLQQIIPNQVGRYTDEFYPTATGDNFQKLGHNTILIEAGYFKNDNDREVVRELNFYALVQGLLFIADDKNTDNYKDYFNIPNNSKRFLEIIYKNVVVVQDNISKNLDVGIQYKFKIKNNQLIDYQFIEKIGDLSNYCTYNYINAENKEINELKLSNS
ncbi:MAG TPA: M14 family zinc carboxypeptidase, partial [Flavobacteriaceae bacterium]|nr:M14 family zinc carboxypeptidase [Flavobacteriaceae bacterium]